MAEQKDAEVIEKQLKKKLQTFLADMIRFGCVKGFRYFVMYMRGREEALLSVINEPADADHYSISSEPTSPLSLSSSAGHFAALGASFTSGNLPYDKQALLLSAGTQKGLSRYGDIGVGLPPASPSDGDRALGDPNTTLFLLAGYAKYLSPYVWVRTNHDRLAQFSGAKDKDRDHPLKLKTVRKFAETDIKVWDIIAEVVKLCTYPPPRNPFAVDFSYFETLQAKDRLLATGAMVHALQSIVVSKADDTYYIARVMKDLQQVTKVHYETLREISVQRQLECLEEYLAQSAEQYKQQAQTTSRSRKSSGHYPRGYGNYLEGYTFS